MRKLFVVTYGGGHSNIIANLYPELIKKFDVVILALTSAEKVLIKNQIPFISLMDYKHKIDPNDEISELGKQFILTNEINCEQMGREYSSFYYGLSLLDMVKNKSLDSIGREYIKYGRQMFLPICAMESILEIEKPDAVLVTNSPRFERAAILVAKKRGIPTFAIEDLFGDSRVFSPYDKMPNYWSDYIFVMNKIAKENIQLKNLDVFEIIITGQPAFQNIEFLNLKKENIIRKYAINQNSDILCWASQHTQDERLIFNLLMEWLKKCPNYFLIIKPHPNQDTMYMENEIYNSGMGNVVLIKGANIHEIIFISDTLLTQDSTVGVEAILMGKPILVMNPLKRHLDTDYFKMGLANEITDWDSFKKQMEVIYCSENNLDLNEFKGSKTPSKDITRNIDMILAQRGEKI